MLNIFKLITIVGLLFFSLAQASEQQENELEQVSLQLQWIDQFQFAGYYMAKEKGFYKEVGLDVELKKYNSLTPVSEVVNKKATYGIGRSTLIIDKSNGADIKLLAAIFQSSPSVFISTKKSNIKNIKDFSDKSMMITEDASTSVPLLAIAKREGLEIDSVKLIKHSFNIEDLINNKTDLYSAYISNEPFILKEKGIEINIFNPAKLGFDFYDDILFTSDFEIKNHKQRAINFTNASLKGWKYAFSHIDETVELILKKYNPQNKSKEALLFEANELKKLAYSGTDKIGKLDLNDVQRIYDIYNVFGHIKKNIDLENFIVMRDNKKYIELTQEEKNFINSNQTIRFTGDPNWLPFEAFDKDGKYIGIISEFLQHIEKQTGIHFKKIVSKDWTDALNIAKNGEVDVISGDAFDEILDKNFNPIKTYIKNPVVIVMKNSYGFIDNLNDIEDKKIAIIKDYGYNQDLYRAYPNINFIEVENIQEALLGVETGKYDASVASLATSNFFILDMGFKDIGIVGKTITTLNVTLFVNKDKPLLHSILNKSINSLTQKERQDILRNWYQVHSANTVDYDLLIKSTLVFIAILLLFVYRQYILNKHNKNLEKSKLELENISLDLQMAQSLAKIGSWRYKINEDIVTWSDEVYKIFQIDKIQYPVKTFNDFFSKIDPKYAGEVNEAYTKHLQEGKPYEITHELLLDDGTSKWVYEKCETIFDDNAKPIESIGVIQDVTELKQKDEMLINQSRHAAMGEMIGMIAHQWRQPLSSISMDANNMLMDIAIENFNMNASEEYANSIAQQTQHLSQTIDDFRNFFKPDKVISKVNIEDILDQTLSIVKDSLKNNNIELTSSFETQTQVNAYPRELMQVLVNIITNAKDALVSNKTENALVALRVYEDEKYINTEISDNGGGIDVKILAKVFDPYFSTKDEKNGTGLGLYMSKMIIEDHLDGVIEMKNKDDGACCIVRLVK